MKPGNIRDPSWNNKAMTVTRHVVSQPVFDLVAGT